MSANAEMLAGSEPIGALTQDTKTSIATLRETTNWNPQDFAREQIRGLVRKVFFAAGAQPVKQVVLSSAEPNGDVANICERVGQALAQETSADVAVVSRRPGETEMMKAPRYSGRGAIKSWANQVATNLWHVPEFEVLQCGVGSRTGQYWLSCLAQLRNEFGYAVIHGPSSGISSEAGLLAELADGIILVLDAHSTRRAAARKIKDTLNATRSRILGAVLSERSFPIPEGIYRLL